MLYGFDPEYYRRVLETHSLIYTIPDRHPNRRMPDFHDVFFVIDGYCNVCIGDEELDIMPGDIAVLPAGYRCYGRKLYPKNTRTYYIHFEKGEKDRPVMDSEFEDTNMLFAQTYTHGNGSIITHFHNIEKCFWSNDKNRERRCSALLYLLLSEINDIHRSNKQKHDGMIFDLLDFIDRQQDKFFTITELANKAHISPKSLTSHFRQETGQTLHKYQMNKKLDRVASILKTESMSSLKNIALNFGFYDEFHLSSAFKQKFGVSPINYIKKNNVNNKY